MTLKIIICVNDAATYHRYPYQMKAISAVWAAAGAEVELVEGPPPHGHADLVVSHVDLTVTPQAYRTAFEKFPLVLNAQVHDISKRSISRYLVRSPRETSDPVIVKTNLNCGGGPERGAMRRGRLFSRGVEKILRRFPWPVSGILDATRYPTFPDAASVPWPVWRNPRLIVEQLRTERKGDLYCLRQYIFLGDREIASVSYSPHVVVKAADIVHRERLDVIPPALRELRARLGFDFGKFDYVEVDGEVIVFDVNRTPTFANLESDTARAAAAELAPGIHALLASARAVEDA